jgi:hypothetical protein
MDTHGINIGLERSQNNVFLSIKAVGKLTHDDYELIVPMLESALAKVTQPKIYVLFDMSEFHDWELHAAWDDFKLGLSHGAQFEKIALVGPLSWQALAAKVASWFISGEVRTFSDKASALKWLY